MSRTGVYGHVFLALLSVIAACGSTLASGRSIFNVRDFGATAVKSDDGRPAIQKAIDACAAAGGGEVYLPAGEYTSGTLRLRSHVRIYVDAGATLFGSTDPQDFNGEPIASQAALFYGEGIENISIEGRGTVDGQAKYDWRLDDPADMSDSFIRPAKRLMKSLGKPLMRDFPEGYPRRTVYPHLVYLGHCKDVRISGISLLHSQSWTIAMYATERVVVDGIYIHTNLEEAVWCDGIDMDGCKNIRIANSTIETGDDCIIFISYNAWGPALPTENVTVSNCRLSSSATAIKFSEANAKGVRNVVIDNCMITNSSEGISFSVSDGGFVSDVEISNLTIALRRFDWYHVQGTQGGAIVFLLLSRAEWEDRPPRKGEPEPGVVRNVTIRNVIAHSMGPSNLDGNPNHPIEGLTLENIKLFMSSDPSAAYDVTTHAMRITHARNLKLKGIEVGWEKPTLDKWQSALDLEDVQGVVVDGFSGRQAWPQAAYPAIAFQNVSHAIIRNSVAEEGTGVFLKVSGDRSRDFWLYGNDLRNAKVPYQVAPDAKTAKPILTQNLTAVQ